ncbi:hypothetical protein [Legionella sp. WA2024007413]
MLTSYHLRLLIEKCREIGGSGLDSGVTAAMPQLQIDILKPPHDFLGAQGNPAIFVNKNTYKLLGQHHKDWIINQTIALKISFLEQKTINIIGAIVHEAGHAFNVAAKIANSEANAYIYEIEVLRKLFKMKSPLLFGCTAPDLQAFFKERLPFYTKEISNKYLADLVRSIKYEFKLEEMTPPTKHQEHISVFVTGITLFTQKQGDKEREGTLGRKDNFIQSF